MQCIKAAASDKQGLLHCRDAVISGGFLYVLAVTTGNMPQEGLSGSGSFSNGGSSATPSDIYVAKVDLSKCVAAVTALCTPASALCLQPCLPAPCGQRVHPLQPAHVLPLVVLLGSCTCGESLVTRPAKLFKQDLNVNVPAAAAWTARLHTFQ
jgi:hypothetical protein